MAKDKKPKRKAEQDLIILEPTPKTPEQLASVFMKAPPRKKWKYLEKEKEA